MIKMIHSVVKMSRCSSFTIKGLPCKKKAVKENLCCVHCPKELHTCGICLDEKPKKSKNNITLECGHIFCKECINEWIIEKTNIYSCPTCRSEIKNESMLVDAYHWAINTEIIKITEVTNYILSDLEPMDLLAMLSKIDVDTVYFSIEQIENLLDDKKLNVIFEKLKTESFTEKSFLKTKEFPEKLEKIHVFIY